MSTHRANLHTIILDRQAVQREASLVRLLLAVATAANDAPTIEAAMQVCMDEVCAHTGWPIGHLYLLSPDGRLLSTSIWHLDRPKTFDVFCRETEALHLERGIGLPGQVLASGNPLWITDVSSDAYFARRREAQQTGIRSAFAFPVLVGNEVVAVLEFFSQGEVEPDEPLLEVMANIGAQLGRVVERERATRALREREQEKHVLLQSIDQGIYGIDEHGLCTFVNRSGAQMLGYDPEELLGKNMHFLIHHSHADGSTYPVEECPIYRASTTGEGCRIDHEVLWKKDGTCFSAEYSSHPIKKGNKVSGAAVSFTDITERKQAERAILESEKKYRMLVDHARDGIAILDRHGNYLEANKHTCEVLGYTREEMLKLNVRDVIYLSEKDKRPLIVEILRARKGQLNERLLRRKDGTLFPVEINATLLDDGNIQAMVRDITDRKQIEEALQESERKYRQVIERASDGILTYDQQGAITDVNPIVCEILGYSRHELLALNVTDIIDPEDLKKNPLRMEELRSKRSVLGERLVRRKDGSIFPVEMSATLSVDGCIQAIARDITERKQVEQLLNEMATHDALTGLFNPREMMRILGEETGRFSRYGHPLSLMMLDIDHFKAVNDTYGHQVGDEVLQWVAKQFQESLRSADRPARYGGEEFAAILPDTAAVGAMEIAERLRRRVAAKPFTTMRADGEYINIPVTISVGVADIIEVIDGIDAAKAVISKAYQALYQAKRSGRNRTVLLNQITLATVPLAPHGIVTDRPITGQISK